MAWRAKKFPFRPGIDFNAIGMVKNLARVAFEILGQTGVSPVTYPIWLEWPWAGLARTDFAQARARHGAQKSFRFDRESISV